MKNDDIVELYSWKEAWIVGLVWSLASVGWIAMLLLGGIWLTDGFAHAVSWFGMVMLSGAGIFLIALLCTLICEVINLTEKNGRRNALKYFSVAFVINFSLGGVAILLPFLFSGVGSFLG